ncbi:MAG: metal-sensitive transcriptional regulator [Bryobacterales bacterium]|nr:metal-sensitive transcriptional regulator [Bryobacterales bacterium]
MPESQAETGHPHSPCGCSTEPGRKAIGVDPEIKAANLRRLRRIEGQVRGLQRMVDGDQYCADILVQLSAVQEALRAVGRGLMKNHLEHCAATTFRNGSAEERTAMAEELLQLIYKHAR